MHGMMRLLRRLGPLASAHEADAEEVGFLRRTCMRFAAALVLLEPFQQGIK